MVAPMRRTALVLSLLTATTACVPETPPKSAEPTTSDDAKAQKDVRPLERTPELAASLEAHLAAESVDGVIAILDTNDGKLQCSDLARCQKAYRPASTFKIPHTLAALEEGVLENADSPMKWDGKEYTVDDWNQDHTLKSAMATSCVPCFQAVARKLGDERERAWLEKFEYGNRDASGALDLFWLEGGLRITPIEQLDFLYRLDRAELPVKETSRATTLEVITKSETDTYTLRAKTGAACDPTTGWYVGYLESGPRRTYIAVALEGRREGADAAVDVNAARTLVALRALREVTGLRID